MIFQGVLGILSPDSSILWAAVLMAFMAIAIAKMLSITVAQCDVKRLGLVLLGYTLKPLQV